MIAIAKKQIFLLCLIFVFTLPLFAKSLGYDTDLAAQEKSAAPGIQIYFDGREIPLKNDMPKLINGIVYTPLRDTVAKLRLHIYWDPDTSLISVFNNENIFQFNQNTGQAFWNGFPKAMPPCFLYNSKTYISIRYLAEVFQFDIATESYGRVISIMSTAAAQEAMASSKSYDKRYVGKYTSDDIFWMAKIVHAEAQGESYEAKLAVANVVLNRREYAAYPNSVEEIIFDKKSGVQFTPTSNGSIYCNPSPDSIRAAIDSLNGKNNAKSVLFFINPRYASSSWVSDNRTLAFTLENHSFYY